jgi:hypothetical protein
MLCIPSYGVQLQTEFFILQNIFWKLWGSDPYRALSFDRLHTNHLGLFKHLWEEAKRITKEMGRETQRVVDKQ